MEFNSAIDSVRYPGRARPADPAGHLRMRKAVRAAVLRTCRRLSGASMAGVNIVVSRPDTGFERATTRNATATGRRDFCRGAYSITFEHTGFKTLRREGVLVTTGQMAAVDVDPGSGDISEAVAVTADARMVSGDSAAIARTLDRTELEALPTSARNITQLLAIEPGVSADISELLSNDNASISPSVNGARTTNNSFVFNGIDVTNMLCCNSRINGSRGTIDAGGGTLSRNIAPAPETLEEVKLQTSLYDASTGRNGGGNFQVVSKSGTNTFSGTAYHYFQNDKLIANDFFFNRAGTDKPLLRRNEGGFTVGGPISAEPHVLLRLLQNTGPKRRSSTKRATPCCFRRR